jgi:hypothetical protein
LAVAGAAAVGGDHYAVEVLSQGVIDDDELVDGAFARSKWRARRPLQTLESQYNPFPTAIRRRCGRRAVDSAKMRLDWIRRPATVLAHPAGRGVKSLKVAIRTQGAR